MFNYGVVWREFEFIVGAKTGIVVLAFRGSIDPSALILAERALFVIARDDVLSKFRTNGLKQTSKMPNDGIVTQNGMLRLNHVINNDASKDHGQGTQDNPHLNRLIVDLGPELKWFSKRDWSRIRDDWTWIEVPEGALSLCNQSN